LCIHTSCYGRKENISVLQMLLRPCTVARPRNYVVHPNYLAGCINAVEVSYRAIYHRDHRTIITRLRIWEGTSLQTSIPIHPRLTVNVPIKQPIILLRYAQPDGNKNKAIHQTVPSHCVAYC
jgi:hypothetical protein